MPITLGAHHPRLRAARALLSKKGRSTQQRFLLEGPTLLAEALSAQFPLEAVFATEAAWGRYPILAELPTEHVALVSETSLASLSALEQPSGIVAIAIQREAQLASVFSHPHVLLLAGLNDPGNVGTLLRSACAFGIGGVLLLQGGVELYHPKIVRAAMGALFRLDARTITPAEFATASDGRPLIAASMDGVSLDQFSFPPRSVIMIGHERQGIAHTPLQPQMCVGIPQQSEMESLNAGVAGSILLYVLARENRLSSLG